MFLLLFNYRNYQNCKIIFMAFVSKRNLARESIHIIFVISVIPLEFGRHTMCFAGEELVDALLKLS